MVEGRFLQGRAGKRQNEALIPMPNQGLSVEHSSYVIGTARA